MGNASTWQHRKADSDEERFGLLDNPRMLKYKRQPLFQEPEGELPSMRPLTALGVTSGVGSMLIGCDKLGFKVVGNIEWRDYYRFRSQAGESTFIKNFPGAFMARGFNDIPANMMPGGIDFALGHPECGRFSSLSHSVALGTYKDSRGSDASDIPLFLKMMAELRPRFFLMDDLPASFDVLPMSAYVEALPDYDLYPEWISNWGYGNIQKHRNRMFIVGALKSEKFVFTPGEAEHGKTLRDVIGDIIGVDPGELENTAHVNPDLTPGRYCNMRHYGDRPSWGELSELFETEAWGKNLKYYSPDGEEKVRPGTTNPKWNSFCPVLSGGYNPIHPMAFRPLTIKERARIQGFPDDFTFYHDEQGPFREVWEPYDSDGQRGIKQTGKAMPIQFCSFVADQIKHHIEGEPFAATGRRVIKPNEKVTQAKEEFCRLSGYTDQAGACGECWHRAKCPLFLELKGMQSVEETV
jgi:DNA (cytosine-5)-methyltransferase 1